MTLNPVLIALATLLRLQYGDSLDYVDGGRTGTYRSRVDAALDLYTSGAVSLQHVTTYQGTRYQGSYYIVYVKSRTLPSVTYRVDPYNLVPAKGRCQCDDALFGGVPVCVHGLVAWIAIALQAGFDALPPITNHHADAEHLAAALA